MSKGRALGLIMFAINASGAPALRAELHMPSGNVPADPVSRIEGYLRIFDGVLDILRANAPVIETNDNTRSSPYAFAIPAAAGHWSEIDDCELKTYPIGARYANLFVNALTLMETSFKVVAQTDCLYRDDPGQYIKSVSIIFDESFALVLQRLRITAEVAGTPRNVALPGQPALPAIQIKILINAGNFLNARSNEEIIEIRGNGIICHPLENNGEECLRGEWSIEHQRALREWRRQHGIDAPLRDFEFPDFDIWRRMSRTASLAVSPRRAEFAELSLAASSINFDGALQ